MRYFRQRGRKEIPIPEKQASAPKGCTLLANNRGKKIVIDVWASWCKDCLESLPDIKKLQDDDRIESAGRNGGDRVKWAIIGIIGSSAIIGTITLIFNLVEKIGHN